MELMLSRECATYSGKSPIARGESVGTPAALAVDGQCFVRRPLSSAALERHEYVLNATSLHATEVMLNGVPLRAEAAQPGSLPPMPPVVLNAARGGESERSPPSPGGSMLTVPVGPLSISFFVFPNARLPVCLDEVDEAA